MGVEFKSCQPVKEGKIMTKKKPSGAHGAKGAKLRRAERWLRQNFAKFFFRTPRMTQETPSVILHQATG